MERFNLAVPIIKMHKLFFPEEQKGSFPIMEAMEELMLISASGIKSKHDDFIDTISMLMSLTPWKPTETGDMSQRAGDSLWELDEPDDTNDNLGSYIV